MKPLTEPDYSLMAPSPFLNNDTNIGTGNQVNNGGSDYDIDYDVISSPTSIQPIKKAQQTPCSSPTSDHDYALKYEHVTEDKAASLPNVTESRSRYDVTTGDPKMHRVQNGVVSKDEKYRNRRDKNNVASKRSRQARKQKVSDMKSNISIWQAENAKLRENNKFLADLAKKTKDYLIKCMANK